MVGERIAAALREDRPEERAVDPDADLVLSAFHRWTKQDGFYRDRVNGAAPPARLVMAEKGQLFPEDIEQIARFL